MSLPNPGPAFDHEVALARVGGDPQLLKEIALLFTENYTEWTHSLRAAVNRGDAEALERSAHELKGAVANFGASAAFDAALRLERIGRGRNLADALQVLETLELALAALRPELEAL